MKAIKGHRLGAGFVRSLALSLSFFLVFGQLLAFASQRSQKQKHPQLSEDQRIAHVLSRLTFGARPGDFERVKSMGVEAFINQQLDPDSLDVSATIARLKKLPTLGMATPVIIEQYTPPKPVVAPSPVPSKSPDAVIETQKLSSPNSSNPLGQTPQLTSPNLSTAPAEMQMDAKKEGEGRTFAPSETKKAPDMMAMPIESKSGADFDREFGKAMIERM